MFVRARDKRPPGNRGRGRREKDGAKGKIEVRSEVKRGPFPRQKGIHEELRLGMETTERGESVRRDEEKGRMERQPG